MSGSVGRGPEGRVLMVMVVRAVRVVRVEGDAVEEGVEVYHPVLTNVSFLSSFSSQVRRRAFLPLRGVAMHGPISVSSRILNHGLEAVDVRAAYEETSGGRRRTLANECIENVEIGASYQQQHGVHAPQRLRGSTG